MRSSISWDITPYSRLKFNRHFEGERRLHFLCRRIEHARNDHGSRRQEDLRLLPESRTLHNHRCENTKPYNLSRKLYFSQQNIVDEHIYRKWGWSIGSQNVSKTTPKKGKERQHAVTSTEALPMAGTESSPNGWHNSTPLSSNSPNRLA